ncbi:MAG TPA: Uma2 family endonuclease [Tepidisphaeraceae bacterium]|nr:Uma2 family endonuclease [Tepidisphaeraceae bacterium]
MSTSTRPITAAELFAMPNNARRELVRGEVREMTPAGSTHGSVTNRFAFLLSRHVYEHELGEVFAAETGFRLRSNPDTVRGADVAFISKARIPKDGPPAGFWPGAPDLAVEVVSPGDTLEEVEEKVDDYLSAGARMVIVITPRRKTLTIHRPGANPVILREGDVLDAGDVVPGFRCKLSDIFV